MACSHQAPNGQTSVLYSNLEQVYGSDKAHDIWTIVRGQQFLNSYGDWLTGAGTEVPLDDNGEPTYTWVKETLGLTDPTAAEIRKQETVTFEEQGSKQKTLRTRDSEQIMVQKIQALYQQASQNPDTDYIVSYKNLGERRPYLSGYTSREMANLFDQFEIPSNIRFDPSFENLVVNSTRRIKGEFTSDTPVEFITQDRNAVIDSMSKILTPKLAADGRVEGYFTPVQQQETVDTIVYATKTSIDRDPNSGINSLIYGFYAFQQKALALERSGENPELRKNLDYIYRQRVRFADAALRQLEGLGLRVDASTKAKILNGVDKLKPLGELDKKNLEATAPTITAEDQIQDTGEFIEIASRGLRDWSDVSFEIDPKDTASARIKMFIAAMPEMDRGVYRAATSEKADVVFDPITITIGDTRLSALISKVGVVEAMDQWKAADPVALQRLVKTSNRKSLWVGTEGTTKAIVSYLSTNYPMIAQENFLGMRKLVDFEATFQDILENLAATKQNLQSYIDILNNSGKPNLQYIAQQLTTADPSIQKEFTKVMSKQYQQFTMMLFNRNISPDGRASFSLNPINANRYNQRNTIIKNWKEQQKLSDIMITSATGERVMDVERIRSRWLPMLDMFRKVADWSDPKNLNTAKTAMGNIFRVSGIDMTDQMISYLFDNMEKLTKGTSLSGGLLRQFSVTEDGKPSGMFSAFIMKAAGVVEANDTDISTEDRVKRSELYNPLYTEPTTMGILTKVAARYTPVLHSSNHKSIEGKNVWDYGHNTKLSHKFREFTQNFETQKAKFDQVDIAKNNWLLTAVKNNPNYLDTMKLGYLDGLKATWAKKGTTRTGMSNREQMLMVLALFQNQGRGFNSKNPRVHYVSLTHSDKTTTPVFMDMPRINTGKAGVVPRTVIGGTDSALYNVFRSEYARIINQSGINFNDARYDKGKGLFYFMPAFNYDAMKDMVSNGELSQKEFELIWNNGARDLTRHIRDDKELPVINKILQSHARKLIDKTISSWEQEGIIDNENFNTMFDKSYVDKILTQNSITKSGEIYSDNNGQVLMEDQVHDIVVETAAKDFAINYFLMNTALSQLFYGDPAQTFKGKAGQHDLVNVSATMKEYAKRLAKDIAPGHDPSWEPTQSKYNTITLADVTPAETYLKNFPALADAYSKVEGTDAQEFTTVKEHIDVKYANGEISKKIYDEMNQIIKDAGPGGYYEFTIPEHKAIIMQPMKPVFAGTREPVNGAMLDDYVKSSSYPLYPPFTAGTEMEKMRSFMETENIQRANYESAKKIGSPTQPARMFSKDGKFIKPSDVEVQGAFQTLDRSGFRIQQEVPYDEEKERIKTVSQMNKLITEGIENIQDFNVAGEVLNGSGVRALKEQVRSKMIGNQLVKFLQEFNVREDAALSSDWNIGDKSGVYDMLAEEARRKGYTMNELQSLLIRKSNGDLAIPLMFNTASDRFESMLMSMVKKIAEVKMPGKSFVQASSVGFTFTSESRIDNSKVVWAAGYDGSALKTLREENGTVKAAQVLIPFNFTTADGTKLDVMDYAVRQENKWVIDTEKIPDSLLQLVGARIPNQGHNSMLPIEVVGFIPANMGDLVVVPSAITKQMGADFDVDKLYTYKRNYNHDPETGKLSGVQPGMETEQQLQDKYFDIHWGVLTHPQMIERVLRPLDKDDLKDENQKLQKPSEEDAGYYDVMNQLSDFQSGKEAKTLVGSTSLSVTFNAVIQNKDLHLYTIVPQIGDDGAITFEEQREFIDITDEHTGQVLSLTNLSGNGVSYYTKKDGDAITPEAARTKHDNHTTVQSAAVDNAKERSLDNLNLTTNTYRAASAFIQLETMDGKAANLKYITRLMTQPIIKDFDRRMKMGNDALSKEFTADLRDKTITDLARELGGDFSVEENQQAMDIKFSPQTLLRAQNLDPSSKEYAIYQLAALNLFRKLDDVGKRLGELKSLSNQDTNGAGPSILAAMDKLKKMEKVNQVPINNADQIFRANNTLTEQGNTFNATVTPAYNILTQLLPYHIFEGMFEDMMKTTGRTSINVDQQRNIIRSMRSYVYTSGQQWWADATQERVRLLYGRGQLGEGSLAKRLEAAKRTWGKDNYFIQRLNPVIAESVDSPDYVEYQAISASRIDEDQNNRGWLSMLVSNQEEERKLGEDLIRYAYLTGGIQDANSFVKYVPTSYIANTEFGDMLVNKVKEMVATDQVAGLASPGFFNQYFQHNPEQAMQIDRDALIKLANPTGTFEGDYPEVFKIPFSDDPVYEETGIGKYVYLEERTKLPVPFISYRSDAENKWILYSYQQIGADEYYVRIDTLGNKYTDEYIGTAESTVRSIFPDNRSMAVQVEARGAIEDIYNDSRIRLGNYYENQSSFEKIGVKEGDANAIGAALRTIKADKTIPEAMRVMADILHNAQSFYEEYYSLNVLYPGDDFKHKSRIVFDSDAKYDGRSFMDGRIVLNPNIKTKNRAAEVFLHELTHQRLQSIIMAAGYDERIVPQHNKEKLLSRIDQYRKDNPEIVKSLDELDRIRYEALNELRNRLGPEKFNQIKAEVETMAPLESEDHVVFYAVSNLHELTSHVMSANSVVLEYLNGVRSSRGTLINRVWGIFTDVIAAIAKSFGIKVKEGSLLKDAIAHVLKLTTFSQAKDVNITSALVYNADLFTDNQQEAESIDRILKESYGRQTNIDKTELGFNIHTISNAAPAKLTSQDNSQIARISRRLIEQLDEAGRDISKAATPKEEVAARIRYRALMDDLSKLQRTRDLDVLADIGNRQLAWVDRVLKTPGASATDIQAAINATNVWSGLIELLYGDLPQINSTNPKFDNIQAEAQKKRIQLVNSQARDTTIKALSNRIEMSTADFGKNIEEINAAEANFLTLARTKSKLVQGIAILGRQAANNKTEEIDRMRKRLLSLNKRMKDAGVKGEDFLEDSRWTVVQRLSADWYKFNSELSNKRDSILSALDKSPNLSDKEIYEKKAKAWDNYWDDLRKNVVFVDTREFFDFKDGAAITGKKYDEALEKLIKNVGSADYAKELLSQATERFKEYIEEREVAKQYFEQDVFLTDEEKAGKNDQEQKDLLAAKQKEAINGWLQYNSPNEFLNRVDGKTKNKTSSNGDRWLVSAPHANKPEYFSEKYRKIQSNDRVRPLYEEFKAEIEEMISYLPATEKEKLNPGFMPIVSVDTITSLSDIVSKFRNWDATLMNTFAATEEEEFARVRPNEIPILYTRESKRIASGEVAQSTDVMRVTEVFGMMALHYKHMAPVLDQINVAESIVKEVNRQRVSGETDGRELRNLQDSIKYFKDALIYKKPKELEGKIDSPIYSMNPAKQIKIQSQVKELIKQKEDLEKQIFDAWSEGIADTSDLDAKLDDVNKELDKYDKQSHLIYGSKATDTLISINQMKALSYNPFSAVSNFTFGMISVSIHAAGRLDYGQAEARRAMGIMMNSVGKYFSFGTVDNPQARKVMALMHRTDIMGDVVDTQYGKTELAGKTNALKSAVSPFNWQKSGDYYAKGVMMVAMMLKKTVEVTEKATGNKLTIPLWEAVGNDGTWDTVKYEDNPAWYSEDVSEQTEWNNYRDRMRKVGIMVFGNQDKNAPLMAKKNWLKRLVGQFRMSWFPEGIATRFISERYDAELGRAVKGRWRTYGTLGVFTSFSLIAKQLLSAIPGVKVDPFTGVTDKHGNQIAEVDIENMRKNFAGLAWTVAFSASILMIQSFYDDDRKGKKKTLQQRQRRLLINMLIRNYQDLKLYSSPDVFQTVSGNLLPAATVITDSWKAMQATGKFMLSDNERDKQAFDKWISKVCRAIPIANLYPKTKFMLNRDVDAISK